MEKHRAKKSLGQNFLKSIPALTAIVKAGDIAITDTILEIGPGKGALTSKLLEKAGTVVAVEKDRELVVYLQEKFAEEIKNKKLILLNEDILEYNFASENFKVIANIPYNITGAILKKFLTAENQPQRMVLMVQHEVAKRIVARDGSESILSISVKAYGNPKLVMKVPARYFSPAPKVDSAIIAITDINRKNFKNEKLEEIFWKIVKAGFAHKRKMLIGNLKESDSRTDWLTLFTRLSIPEKTRAENITLKNWLEIANML